jgi:Protein of unknown function (DUF1501)
VWGDVESLVRGLNSSHPYRENKRTAAVVPPALGLIGTGVNRKCIPVDAGSGGPASFFDQAVTALVEDLDAHGLDRRVLVVMTGQFGRTPRISYAASSGGGVASGAEGTVQPGRDHWPRANSMLWAGGGIATGRAVGATDGRGEDVVERRVGPPDFLATVYRHLGIDHDKVALPDQAGRPVPIVQGGQAIAELAPTP